MSAYSRYFILLCLILLAKAAAIIIFILYGKVGLGPDEAQYWTWSQTLDWGYYSKPPGIAWQIWLSTRLFGNTELGVRFGAVVIGFALPAATFFLAKACRLQPATAFWSGMAMAFIPLGVMGSFLAITDGGMILFWTLACIPLALALSRKTAPNYYLLGFLILCGALFKWPIYYMWAFVLLTIPFVPKFANRHAFAGVLISLIGLLPSLVWNWQHGWATFRHVAGNIKGTDTGPQSLFHGNFWAFVGEQAILLSPILFVLLLCAFFQLLRKGKEIPASAYFCGVMSFAILFAYCLLAVFKKMQGNWCDFAYPSAIVFLCWYALEKVSWGKIWLKAGIGLSALLCIWALSIPYLESHQALSNFPVPYKMNPFRHNVGWDKLKEVLKESGYDPKDNFLFSDKYQTSSILSFYGEDQKRAYFLNLHQIRHNQFSFWPGLPEEQKGKTGFFVVTENSPHMERNFPRLTKEYQELLQPYFREVKFLGMHPLYFSNGVVVKGALIFQGVDYNGRLPAETRLY